MRSLMLLCSALIAVGCSTSPTAPTPVGSQPPVGAPSPLANLRWDVTAPGCQTQAPPSPLPDPAQARLEPGAHGSIVAYWPSYRLDSQPVMLHATLIESGTELLVCSWDVADL